jgi:two-component system, chemotaxis family, CheB/CheR fusion protein
MSGIRLINNDRQKKARPNVTTNANPTSSGLRMDGRTEKRSAAANEGKLAASIAHEISNPLDALLNLLYLIEAEAILTEKGRHCLALAREEVNRVAQIAHEALTDYRAMPGPKDTSVSKLLGAVVDFYKARFESRGITVNTRYCHHGNLAILAGPLRQVFSNLLLNAADAMPEGGRLYARVSAAHEWRGQERQGLRVTFADTGCGIPADKLPKVLQPFFTTKGPAGNGLGLSLVKDVVQKHRGVLRIRSSTREGRSGSVFTIFLPSA